MRVNGGSAQFSNKDGQYDKRAAMPQGKWKAKTNTPVHLKASAIVPRKEFVEEDSDKALFGASRGYARRQLEKKGIENFDYAKQPVRGVNIGGWLVRKFILFSSL
jgi:hypothetical protein